MRREVKAIHRDSLSGEMRFQTLFKNADSWAFDAIPYGDKFVANGCFNGGTNKYYRLVWGVYARPNVRRRGVFRNI